MGPISRGLFARLVRRNAMIERQALPPSLAERQALKGVKRMAFGDDDWRNLLDRFATKSDLEQFQTSVMERFSVMNAKLDQYVVKDMQALIAQQEVAWRKDASDRMAAMQVDIDAMKRNRAPEWFPNVTTLIGWALMILVTYFRPHLGP